MGSAKRKRVEERRRGLSSTSKSDWEKFSTQDRRVLEKQMWIMDRMMKREKIGSVDDANSISKRIIDNREYEKFVPDNDIDRAQILAYSACEKEGTERKNLALKALDISRDCADAYVILAELDSDINRRRELYEKGVEAGRRVTGEETFKKEKGNFWGILETRPYMRAMEGLAETFWRTGNRKEAANIYETLLELNHNDNQGNRYALLLLYLLEYDLKKSQELLDRYDEDSAFWNYDRALLLFLRDGITTNAKNALRKGFESNPYVAPMLLGIVPVPHLGNYVSPGHPDEAASYAASSHSLWVDNPAAMKWLANELEAFIGGRGR